MAPTIKEATIIILDVGENTLVASGKTTFFDRARSCVSKIIQRKIFAKPSDEIGIILMGADETYNDLNESKLGYEHFVEKFSLQKPCWQMLRVLNTLKPSTFSSDWVDGLTVALNFIKTEISGKKFQTIRIILLTNFITEACESNIDVIEAAANELHAELIAISDNVEHNNRLTESQFSQNPGKSKDQTSSEKLFVKVMQKVAGYLCHIDHAEAQLLHFAKKKTRAMPWNVQLTIGSEIRFAVSAYVSVQEEKFLSPFKVESMTPGTCTIMITEHTRNNEKIEKPDAANLVKAYQYGSTLVPVPDEIDEYKFKDTQKCLSCIGFSKRQCILEEYLAGDGSHIVLPQKGCSKNQENIFNALVKAMSDIDLVMLARKVYRDGIRPCVVALFPDFRDDVPFLTMVRLPFSQDVCFLSFPPLERKKTQPTQAQLDAMEKLINSMDLMNAIDDNSGLSEAFAIDSSLNPVNQHLCHTVAFRALHPNDPLPTISDELMQMIGMPEKVRLNSADALNQIKELFPLEVIERNVKKPFGSSSTQTMAIDGADIADDDDELNDKKNVVNVGTVTPAEDFAYLLKNGTRFSDLCSQMESVIFELIFRTVAMSTEKVQEAIMMYREQAKLYGPFSYNKWIKEFKEILIQRDRTEIFDVIVKQGLGPITQNEAPISRISIEQQLEFYEVSMRSLKDMAESVVADDDLDALMDF